MRSVFFFLVIVLLVASVHAETIYHNDTLQTKYGTGDRIKGAINVSFANVYLDAPVKSIFGNTTLRALLGANNYTAWEDYNCSSIGCTATYASTGVVTQVNVANGSTLIGLSVGGTGVRNIEQVRLLMKGAGAPSCSQPLTVDITDAQEYTLTSFKYIDEVCTTNTGCFETDRNQYQEVTIPYNNRYCEKMNLTTSPALRVGGRITNSTQGAPGLLMELWSIEGTQLGECGLPKLPTNVASVDCIIPYSIPKAKEYFVCVRANATSNYKVRAEANAVCGTDDLGSTYALDYDLFAKTLKFDVPTINLTDDTFAIATGINLGDYLSAYLEKTYGGVCNPSCIIPLRLKGIGQQVDLSEAHILYDINGGENSESTKVYSAKKVPALINSAPLVLDIGFANFTIPEENPEKTLELYIGLQRVLEKKLNITTTFKFSIEPTFAVFGKETTFSAVTTHNITSSSWDFGDGKTSSASGKKTTHQYLQQGTFAVAVELTRSDGVKSRKTFEVTVGNPREAANETIVLYKSYLSAFKTSLAAYPLWIQTLITSEVNLSSAETELATLESTYRTAQNDSEFEVIITRLLALEIPSKLGVSMNGSLPLFIGSTAMDVRLAGELSGQEITNEEAVQTAITNWIGQNYDGEIGFSVSTASYSQRDEPLFTRFIIKATAKSAPEPAYLIIGYPVSEISFASPVGAQAVGTGTAIPIDRSSTFEFAIKGSIDPADLGVYISPNITQFSLIEDCVVDAVCSESESHATCPEDCGKTNLVWLWLGLLIVAAAGAYFAMRWWYKRHYEESLFKTKQDLTNITSFIINARIKTMPDLEIRKRLSGAGWTNEQINYAFGKLQKVAQKAPDARFIKR